MLPSPPQDCWGLGCKRTGKEKENGGFPLLSLNIRSLPFFILELQLASLLGSLFPRPVVPRSLFQAALSLGSRMKEKWVAHRCFRSAFPFSSPVCLLLFPFQHPQITVPASARVVQLHCVVIPSCPKPELFPLLLTFPRLSSLPRTVFLAGLLSFGLLLIWPHVFDGFTLAFYSFSELCLLVFYSPLMPCCAFPELLYLCFESFF